jgi:citrate lyase subunit beta/citryl-CoA lyase
MSRARTNQAVLARSYLYVPGSRPDRFASAAKSGADVVILDLEDSVAPELHDQARRHVAEALRRQATAGASVGMTEHWPPLHVRPRRLENGTLDADDLAWVVGPGLTALRLPKCTSRAELDDLDDQLARLERAAGMAEGTIALYPTLESAAGILAARELAAAPRVERLALGATDLAADLGLPPSDAVGEADPLRTARAQVVLASAAAGAGQPIDSVCTAFGDEGRLRAEALAARALGFFGKSVVHPRQVETVNEVFTPTEEEVRRAEAVLEAMAKSTKAGAGATALGGDLVDPAVARRAASIIALAEGTARGKAEAGPPAARPATTGLETPQGA